MFPLLVDAVLLADLLHRLVFLLGTPEEVCGQLQRQNPQARFITAARALIAYASTLSLTVQVLPCLPWFASRVCHPLDMNFPFY